MERGGRPIRSHKVKGNLYPFVEEQGPLFTGDKEKREGRSG